MSTSGQLWSNGVKCTQMWPNPIRIYACMQCNQFLFFRLIEIRTPVPLSQTITFRPLLSISSVFIFTRRFQHTIYLWWIIQFFLFLRPSAFSSRCRFCLKSVTNVKNAAGVIAMKTIGTISNLTHTNPSNAMRNSNCQCCQNVMSTDDR